MKAPAATDGEGRPGLSTAPLPGPSSGGPPAWAEKVLEDHQTESGVGGQWRVGESSAPPVLCSRASPLSLNVLESEKQAGGQVCGGGYTFLRGQHQKGLKSSRRISLQAGKTGSEARASV